MTKKDIIFPFAIVILTIAFAFICLAVYLTNGKSKKWIARKMKIGGILLGLSAFSTGTGCITTCYKPEYVPDHVVINQSNGYSIEIDLDTGNVLTGIINNFDSKVFSFLIADTTELKKQKGFLIPNDGEFSDQTESFSLQVDNNLSKGNYFLRIFACDTSIQDTQNPINDFYLCIKKK